MRQVTLTVFIALVTGFGGGRAIAAPFEPATVPDGVQAVGHLDVDLLRKTQIFGAVGGQTAIDTALDHAPPELRPLAHSLVRSVRGVSFWRGSDHGALYLETRDGRALAQVVAKLPTTPAPAIDGYPAYTMAHGSKTGHLAVFGDTLVLADTDKYPKGCSLGLLGDHRLELTHLRAQLSRRLRPQQPPHHRVDGSREDEVEEHRRHETREDGSGGSALAEDEVAADRILICEILLGEDLVDYRNHG
jgi:hypothetical protein